MSEPIRYTIASREKSKHLETPLVVSKDGELVRWEDYNSLKTEVERLGAKVESLRKLTEWKPIYTAPSFPTKILFGGYFKSGWGDGFWWQHGYKAGALLDMNATHWLPEPQPPAKDEEQTK